MSDLIAYKSNWLIDASYKITLQEQRLLYACIAKIDPKKEMPKTIELTAVEFYLCFPEIGRQHAEAELKKAVDRLWDNSIVVKDPETTSEFRWVQSRAIYHDGEARVSITFSEVVSKYLTQFLGGNFTKIYLKNMARLTSTYSIRFYEILQRFSDTGHRIIFLDDLRLLLKIENKYTCFRDLNKYIVKPAIKELNEKTNLSVSFCKIKKGKAVIGFHFYFSEKSIKQQSQLSFALED